MKHSLAFFCCLAAALGGWAVPADAQLIRKTVTVIRRGLNLLNADGSSEEGADKKEADAPAPMVLRWNNGETLPGEIAGATAGELDWQTPLFDGPLALAWTALHRLDQRLPPSAPKDGFSFTLRDGSHLYGDLTGVTADTVTLRSTRHGEVALKRAEVLNVRRLKGEGLLYAGPLGESGWEPATTERPEYDNTATPPTLGSVPVVVTGPGGALVLPYVRHPMRLKLPLPEKAVVEFYLRSKERLAFRLALERLGDRVRIETWGNELVLAAGNHFTSLRQMKDNDHELALRVCWNRQSRHCEVYTPEGTLLKEWMAPAESVGKESGLRLENKGCELALEFLRVRTWDGQRLASGTATDSGVELADGRTIAGPVAATEGDQVVMSTPGEGPAARFPLAGVDGIVFSRYAPARDSNQTSLTFTDGTLLRGKMAGFKDGSATLETAFTATPLPANVGALRQVFVRMAAPAGTPPGPELKTLDKFVAGDTTLHGRFVADGDSVPHWLAAGALRPATPARSLTGEILRTMDPAAIPAGTTSLFYTRWGDVLPGTLHGLSRAEMEFESTVADVKTLPNVEWTAVQFNVSTGGAIHGFNAPGWQATDAKKEVQPAPKDDKMTLKAGVVAAHPAGAQNGEIKFLFETSNFSVLRVRLFCDGTNPAKGLSYVLSRMGNQFTTGMELSEGELTDQTTTNTQSGAVAVRLAIDDKGVRCYLNNALADTLSYPSAKRAGSGLVMEATSLWGNEVREVALGKFTSTVEPGQGMFQEVNADAKGQALTVPRFRKEDPPHHALLAENGDILRGEIEAVTNTQLGFRMGLETLKVPRERVAAIVVLQKPTDTPPAQAAGADEVAKLLERPVDEQGSYWNSSLNNLIQVVQRSAPALKVKLPANANSARGRFRFTARSVGETLDSICEQFGLSYRVEDGGVVIESGAPKKGPELTQTVYWLKTDALAAKGPLVETLAARGIQFGAGSSVATLGGPRQLLMVNTAENHEKLAKVLANEFGGVLGSPTHWLRLTNGGRLGLTVEKFESDAVVGTHPLYGRCRVSMADVYAIRNTPPDIAAASRTVGEWQLVYAPEPVLPESGGEGSALMGKDAPTFKLAMLEGGDFDLNQEKGRVVVLDFWATWCGPCTKSLPGLIEAMAQFPADQVKLIGMNQAEAPDQVKRFLSTRGWKLAVAMDAGQKVAQQYGVDGIPHTVIVGPDGKVAWVKTGYTPDGDQQAAEAVKKLLAAPAAGKTAMANAAGSATERKAAVEDGRSAE